MTTEPPQRRSRVPPPFPALAYLYRPADLTVRTTIVEADDHWAIPEGQSREGDALLWGRLPLSRRPRARSIEYASRRELAIQRLRARPPAGFRLEALHRLPPVRRPGAVPRGGRALTPHGGAAPVV